MPPNCIDPFIGTGVVLAVIIIVAAGANTNIHISKAIRATPPPIPKKSFLRNESKLGILGRFFPFLATPLRPFVVAAAPTATSSPSISKSSSASLRISFLAASSVRVPSFTGIALTCSPTGSSAPSIMSSPSSTASAAISATSGFVCRFFATGILAAAASATNAWLFVISTRCFLLVFAIRSSKRKLTALCKAPARFGGTRATIFSFDALILPIIAVTSSSTSI